eukprot:16446637-Heterocapsa_arctica.AAC.1
MTPQANRAIGCHCGGPYARPAGSRALEGTRARRGTRAHRGTRARRGRGRDSRSAAAGYYYYIGTARGSIRANQTRDYRLGAVDDPPLGPAPHIGNQ